MNREQNDSRSVLRFKAVRNLTGLSRTTIWRLCQQGNFPQPLKLTARLIGWRAEELLDWLGSRERKVPALSEADALSACDQRKRVRHRRRKLRAREHRHPQKGVFDSAGVSGRGAAREANAALQKVAAQNDTAESITPAPAHTER